MTNPEHQRREPEDRYKVWPTNRDRDAFAAVMSVPIPQHGNLAHLGVKIVGTHEFFSAKAREWLALEPDTVEERASVLVDAVATRLQIVVIDLKADEDAERDQLVSECRLRCSHVGLHCTTSRPPHN